MLRSGRLLSSRTCDLKKLLINNQNLRSIQNRSIKVTSVRASAKQSATMTVLPAAIEGLEPQSLWAFFAGLSAIPRPSKKEERVLSWLIDFANTRNLTYQQDTIGNLVIRRPGSGGGESAPPVIIQGHVDMVTEKNTDTVHDFLVDGIKLLRDGDWVKADGTTLGADNGIGVCAALAVLDLPSTAKLPPIEALFTVDEETGLTGAFQLDGSMLQGRIMLNLDTEDWGEIFIGCAGGGDSVLTLDVKREPVPAGYAVREVKIEGLMGGHSGININEDRGNAVKMAAAVIDAVCKAIPEAKLVTIAGGDKRNAIPRECAFKIAVPPGSLTSVEAIVSKELTEFKNEYGHFEKGLNIAVTEPAAVSAAADTFGCISQTDVGKILAVLSTLPHGVIKYSHTVPGLVETSTNLASIRPIDDSKFRIQCSTRSSLSAPLERCRQSIQQIGKLVGAHVEQDEAYPGWQPQPGAEIVNVVKAAIGEITGTEPPVKAIHAGLECGIIGEKLPGVQSVSFGPTIKGAHSPDERVQISTVKPFFDSVLKVLEVLADRR